MNSNMPWSHIIPLVIGSRLFVLLIVLRLDKAIIIAILSFMVECGVGYLYGRFLK